MNEKDLTWGSNTISQILECFIRMEVSSPDFVISLVKLMFNKTKSGTTFVDFNFFGKL